MIDLEMSCVLLFSITYNFILNQFPNHLSEPEPSPPPPPPPVEGNFGLKKNSKI